VQQPRRRHVHDDASSAVAAPENSLLNPPPTARPPPLTVPQRERYDSTIKYLSELGKRYVVFYKDGLKSVLANRRLMRDKMQRTPPDDRPSILRPGVVPRTFSRADWVLLWRVRHDMALFPLFGLLALISSELTPFIVAIFDRVVPYPCRIPSQVLHARERAENRRRLAFDQLESRHPEGVTGPATTVTRAAARAHVLRTLYISGDVWEYLSVLPPGMWATKGRLRMAFIEGDDANIIRDGGVVGLNVDELRIACETRGINVLGRSETELRGWLGDWLRLTAAQTETERRRRMLVLLLTRCVFLFPLTCIYGTALVSCDANVE
jgi:hypothetical protein